jgi:anti-sigma-K factor RskA
MHPHDCAAVHGDLAELALGTLSGAERSAVLAHVQSCSHCREEVDRLSAAADAVLTLAPEAEPAAGFETRLFARMGVSAPRRRWLPRRRAGRITLAVGALAGALGAGLGLGLATGGSSLPAAVPAPIVASLTADHSVRGEVYLAAGNPGWLFMSVDHVDMTGLATCKLKTANGTITTVGTFWLEKGAGTWAYELPVPVSQVRTAWIVSGSGTVLATAELNR